MPRNNDIKFMRRCLDLAGKAEGSTYPNPLVGAVIVHNDVIIGEGYHMKAGDPHAEANAINAVENRELLKEAVLFVSLEPCSHFGRTPPCTDLILSNGIRKVVIGTTDTREKVAGRGIMALQNAGCKVVTEVLGEDCRWINRRFFTFNEKKRPYIILKWAQSADGYLDHEREKVTEHKAAWITGRPERVLVHKWRAEEQAILAGAGTVRADDPQLNVRYWAGDDPLRLILSSSGTLRKNSAVFRTNGTNIVFTYNEDANLENALKVKLDKNRNSASQVVEYLYNIGIQSLLIEGGAVVLNHFISEGKWDEARIFTGKEPFRTGIKAPVVSGRVMANMSFSSSNLEVIMNDKVSDVPGG
jgi:diaminohydroxyphosphoribosylaminopyrimidine deaminase/5-amino-6-(5-phosphoribosylamino)uracil reductase